MIGKNLAHYKILGPLGKGGMGEVYLAEDGRLGRKVALKTLPPEMAADPERRARFEREAKVVAALNHPNIVTIHSEEEHDGASFYTMEHVEGEVLSELIPEGGMTLSRLYDVAVPLSDALAAAHEKGITHRDLKPANVMVTKEGRIKVLDFGLAKLADTPGSGAVAGADDVTATVTAPMTVEGKILGTVTYMSPEQAEGKPVDPRSDVFSLGVLLYEMATGQKPFGGDSNLSTLTAILRDTPREIGELNPSLPPQLGRIVQRCLAKEPSRRYQTALDVRNELESLRQDTDASDAQRAPIGASATPMRGRRPLFAGLVAVAALAAVVATVVFWPGRDPSAPTEPAAVAGPEPNSIAVLPFANMSGNPDNEYFSDGLAEELLNVLARLQGLRVAARTSSFHFKGYTGDIGEIGKQLNVATVLEGSVRRAGDKVRVTAQLINVADGFHLWSDTYDRELDDIFGIQEDIAAQVVGALEVTLLGEEATRLAKRPTENLAAYDAYLLGQQRMARRRSDSLVEAVEYFQKAIDLDPNYALAYVGLADAHLLLTLHGTVDRRDAHSRAKVAVETALKLDGRLGEAYATRGLIQALDVNVEGAESSFRRAIELSPGYATAYLRYGMFFKNSREPERALEMLRKALDLDPLSPEVNRYLAGVLSDLGRTREAIERYRRAIEIDPGFAPGYASMADVYADDLGQLEEALRWYEKAIEVDPGNPQVRFKLASTYQDMGRFDDAITVWRGMIEADPAAARSSSVAGGLASLYEYVGRFEEAKELWRGLIEADPQSPSPHIGLAELYYELGQADEAVRSLHEASKRDGSSYVPYSLAHVYLALDDESSAQRWWDRFMAAAPGNPWAQELELKLLRRHSITEYEARMRELAEQAPDQFGEELLYLDMTAGRYADAKERIAEALPQLVSEDDPAVDSEDAVDDAIVVAAVLLKTGDRARAELLLRKSADFIDAQPEGVRRANYRMEPVEIYALQGRKEEALAAFRRAIDQHWRGDHRELKRDPTLESLVGDPRFEAMLAEVRDDLARQRQRLAAEGLATP